MPTLDQIIALAGEKWDLYEPATDSQRSAARAAIKNLPVELEQFYAHSDGADIGDVSIFQIDDELTDVNSKRTPAMRPYVFFGSDGGDGFFAIDTQGKLKRGTGAVFWADRSSANTRSWIFAGRSFAAFLEEIVEGRTPWTAQSVAQVDVAAMTAAFAQHRDRWTGAPPLERGETIAAGRRVKVRFPRELDAVLEIANGLEIPGVGVVFFDRDQITAVEGALANGWTGALWIGKDDADNRYVLTMRGWRGSEGSEVVRVGRGESAETAPIIGQLAAVVVAWLEGKKP